MYCWPITIPSRTSFISGNYMAQIVYKRTSYRMCSWCVAPRYSVYYRRTIVHSQWTTWWPVSYTTSSTHWTRIFNAPSAATASSMVTSENFVDVTTCWVSQSRTPTSLWWSATSLDSVARFWTWSSSCTARYSSETKLSPRTPFML